MSGVGVGYLMEVPKMCKKKLDKLRGQMYVLLKMVIFLVSWRVPLHLI